MRRNAFPEFLEPFDPALWRIACDESGVNRANGDADDPVRGAAVFDQALVRTSLVGSERSTSLQQQDLVIKSSFHSVCESALMTGLVGCCSIPKGRT